MIAFTATSLISTNATAGWDFDLPDHRGGTFRLSAGMAAATVVVFFRGHWCPYCRRYLSKLQSNMARFEGQGVQLVAISPEPPATSHGLAQQLELTFPLLSDVDGSVIDRYGVRNGFFAGRSLIPHASVFIFDAAGTLRFKSIDRNFKKRTTVRTIFGVLSDIGVAAGAEDESTHSTSAPLMRKAAKLWRTMCPNYVTPPDGAASDFTESAEGSRAPFERCVTGA